MTVPSGDLPADTAAPPFARFGEAAPQDGPAEIERAAGIDAAHWWFLTLDRRFIAVGAERWMVHVVGIHRHGTELWIQLTRAEDPVRGVVLCVTTDTNVDRALTALSAAFASGMPSAIIDVRGVG